MSFCALCLHLEVPPRQATGTVGLLTSAPALLDAALDRLAEIAGESHVIVHACPEHVVDVYRGRIEGVRMAWRLAEATGTERPTRALQSRATTSSSPA
jgi:predicted secreted protein